MTSTPAALSVGASVSIQGQPGKFGVIVEGPVDVNGHEVYRVAVDGRVMRYAAGSLTAVPVARLGTVKARRFLHDLAFVKLADPYSDVFYSMNASRTKFLVYQFQPVLKFVQSLPHGMLIADEVGLGKTIEAGLILKEMLVRGDVGRVLVVCPSNLVAKWTNEMRLRFGFPFERIDRAKLEQFRQDLDRGMLPEFFGVASLEGLRNESLQDMLEEMQLQLDLVVIDEAHHLRNPATLSYELGVRLSDQTDHILLLSATPVQTSERDLLSLLRLIEPAQFDQMTAAELDELLEPNRYINAALRGLMHEDVAGAAIAADLRGVLGTALAAAFRQNPIFNECLRRLTSTAQLTPVVRIEIARDLQRLHTLAPFYTRTRKRDVEDAARRVPRAETVALSEEERRFYRTWLAYLRARAMTGSGGNTVGWAVTTRERQAASSIMAAKSILAELLADAPVGADFEGSDAELRDDRSPRVSQQRHLAHLGQRVREAAAQLRPVDTKAERFVAVVRELLAKRPGRQILVFATFKGTLNQLSRVLKGHRIEHELISGDVPPQEREARVRRFKHEKRPVLLSSEVGAEGLDFQFCDAVINYDLPWNPMRVEQRIGRIDRFGQQSPAIDVVSFWVKDTIDDRILRRLYERIRVFEQSIGELEPILAPILRELQEDAFNWELDELAGTKGTARIDRALERMENLKRMEEDFEQQRAELLGHGELEREQVKAARDSGRRIDARELQALVTEWLAKHPECGRATETRNDWVLEVRLKDSILARTREWARDHGRLHDPNYQAWQERHQRDGKVWMTFDSARAEEYEKLVFADLNHPFVEVIRADLRGRQPTEAVERVGLLTAPGGEGWPALSFFCLYRLDLGGAEPRTQMLPVVVDARTGQVCERAVAEEMLGRLARAGDGERPAALTQAWVDSLESTAFEWTATHRAALEEWTAKTQAARLATRRATLERGYGLRIKRSRQMASQAKDPRIRRLHEGRARNLEGALAERRAALESAPEPSVGVELLAMAFVRATAAEPEQAAPRASRQEPRRALDGAAECEVRIRIIDGPDGTLWMVEKLKDGKVVGRSRRDSAQEAEELKARLEHGGR